MPISSVWTVISERGYIICKKRNREKKWRENDIGLDFQHEANSWFQVLPEYQLTFCLEWWILLSLSFIVAPSHPLLTLPLPPLPFPSLLFPFLFFIQGTKMSHIPLQPEKGLIVEEQKWSSRRCMSGEERVWESRGTRGAHVAPTSRAK